MNFNIFNIYYNLFLASAQLPVSKYQDSYMFACAIHKVHKTNINNNKYYF